MRDLNYQLKLLCKHSHEGSFETWVGRERQLSAIANQLHDLGFRQLKATSLKRKHVQALVNHWLEQNLSPGSIKNHMSCLRWWAEKVNKRAVVAASNSVYGVPDRQFVSEGSKARDLAVQRLAKVKDENVKMSLRLQQAFGLRREEAIKIQPRWADRGDRLHLKGSWTKGGRERSVPIRTQPQLDLLARAKQLAGTGSLIPRGRSYIEQLNAPGYLGMNKNRFNREVRITLTEIPIGKQGTAFDRLELDAWAEDYRNRCGCSPKQRGDL